MSYPEPIECEDQASLYKQAKFFYDQYEKANKHINKLKKLIIEVCYVLAESGKCGECDVTDCPHYPVKRTIIHRVYARATFCGIPCGTVGITQHDRKVTCKNCLRVMKVTK